MNIDNVFDLLFDILFAMIPQIGWLGPTYWDLVISFFLLKGETLPQFHLRSLQAQSEKNLLNDEIGREKNLTGT